MSGTSKLALVEVQKSGKKGKASMAAYEKALAAKQPKKRK